MTRVARRLLAVYTAMLAPWLAQAYPDGAPPAHSGGFDEPSCTQCHFGEAPRHDRDALRVEGLPPDFESGGGYELRLRLHDDAARVGGFQATVRFAEGAQRGAAAGELSGCEDGTVSIVRDGEAVYAGHAAARRASTAGEPLEWCLRWRAPEGQDAAVVAHVAALAGDDDDSPLGDIVYLLERVVQPAGE